MTDRRGLTLIVAAAVLWGTTGTAQAVGPETSDPVAVGIVRLIVAAPALAALALAGGNPPTLRGTRWRPILLAGMGMAAYQPAFFTAVKETGVALGTVVAIGSAPLLAGMISWFADGERPGLRWWIATIIGIIGVGAIGLAVGEAGANLRGVALALVAGSAFAVYIVTSRRVVGLSHPVGGMAMVFGVAAALSLPFLGVVDLGWLALAAGSLMMLHLGLIATALAYAMFSIGLRTTSAGSAATASLAEPMTASLLGVLLLGEAPGGPGWLGMGLILTALTILASSRVGYPKPSPAGKGWA